MPATPYSFADALAAWMAAAVTPALEYAGVPRALWLGQAMEDLAGVAQVTDPYSVLTVYPGGEVQWVGLPIASIQVKTVGDDAAAFARAEKLFATLFEPDGRPRRNFAVGAYRVVGFLSPRAPGQIGRDAKRRAEITFNFDAHYHPT